MADDSKTPEIKVTDRRHFDRTGEKRPASEVSPEAETPRAEKSATAPPKPSGGPSKESAGSPSGKPAERSSSASPASQGSGIHMPDSGAPGDLSEIATSLSSSFSLLVARLAQETEIYLGLVPYPGKETSEPDLEAARAMIDLLSMLQEKTRGNLEPEETRLLENLLYTYRLEYVRLRPGAGAQ
jgi:hypothetical protein